MVYGLRFHVGWFDVPKGIPSVQRHVFLTWPVVAITCLCCLWAGLYKTQRTKPIWDVFSRACKATAMSILLILSVFYYLDDTPYSRALLAMFSVLLLGGLILSHFVVMIIVRNYRRRGYNRRHYVVVGAGEKGRQLVADIQKEGWLGLTCAFFVDDNINNVGKNLCGVPVYGPIEELCSFVDPAHIDEIYLALEGQEAEKAYSYLEKLQMLGITVRIVPNWGSLLSMQVPSVVIIGSQVLFSAADCPLEGLDMIIKDVFDRVMALMLLLILAIPMCFIALFVKLTSPGPIFYRQVRMGLDQIEFKMIKFRTMKIDSSEETSPSWTTQDDPRRTRIGVFLRKTSLDELPQLFNVLMGHMSLVGPRPERPVLVRSFAGDSKRYILRLKVKAGMTGWAQVHGLRGDTSLRKRLLYDLYYIRNWSLGLDFWILLMTPWHLLKGDNAY